jgi:hypothetical protein
MKIKILNGLIVLAALLNVWYGWKLGCLLSRGEQEAILYEMSQAESLALEKNWQVSGALMAFEEPESAKIRRDFLPAVRSDDLAELERRIEKVAEQMSKMQFPADSVLLIRTEGDRE